MSVECVYRHACPYLDGLSTTWVLEEYRQAAEVYQEHLRIIDGFDGELKVRDERIRVLERENAELKAKLHALHRRQFKANRKKDAEMGEQDVAGASRSTEGKKRKRGAPVGHPGWGRPTPARIDRTVHVPAPTICPHCHSAGLTPMEETHGAHSGRYRHPAPDPGDPLSAWAGVCAPGAIARWFRPARASSCTPPSGRSPSPWRSTYAMGSGCSYRKTAEVFREVFGLTFVPASAVGFDRQAAARGRPLYEDVREKIQSLRRGPCR